MGRPPDTFALAWSNENGNVAMATLTFEDLDKAIDWRFFCWYPVLGSNQRPLPCQGSHLPLI